MQIDRNNYEVYFLDYLEGRLTTEETAALLLFADENPDLKELIVGEEMISLVPDDNISFSPKSALKKKTVTGIESEVSALDHNVVSEITAKNYEDFMVRYYENDLNDSEKSELANFMKDSPTYIKEFEILRNTLLKPDTHIVYPYKSRLKRNFILRPGTKSVIAIVSVAASLLLFSTLFLKYINQPGLKENNNQKTASYHRNIETTKPVASKVNIAAIQTTDNHISDNPAQPDKTANSGPATSTIPTVIRLGFEPRTPLQKASTTERSVIEAPAILNTRQTVLLASAQIDAPKSIERRTDFDGINSPAYYDPDPEALPLKSEGRNISGRLGYTLASGISQAAGTIAREPELSRLLRGKISLSDIAGLGLAGFNLLTDSKLSVSRKYDADGNLKGYAIVDGNKRLKQ